MLGTVDDWQRTSYIGLHLVHQPYVLAHPLHVTVRTSVGDDYIRDDKIVKEQHEQ